MPGLPAFAAGRARPVSVPIPNAATVGSRPAADAAVRLPGRSEAGS